MVISQSRMEHASVGHACGRGDLRQDLLQRIQDDLRGAWFRA